MSKPLEKLRTAGVRPTTRLDSDRRSRSGIARVARLGPDELGRQLEVVYDSRGQELVGYAERILGDRHDAEDVVHEAFVRVFRADPDLRHPVTDTLPRYLKTAVRNEAYRQGSKNTRHRQHRSDAASLDLEQVLTAPDPVLDERVCDEVTIGIAVRTLSPQQHQCFTLRYVDDLPLQAVAEKLGLAVGSVKSYCAEARSRIAACLSAAA